MEPFRLHVFVCHHKKPDGIPCCWARGADNLLDALRREINARGLEDEVQITACESLGLCEHGLNMIVYPEGVWYSGVKPEDAQEIVRSHFEEDTPVERLVRTDTAGLRAEILTNRQKLLRARADREATGALPDEVNELTRAFQESRAILTALELDLFTAVGDGAGATAVAAKLGADARAMEMLLNAVTAIGFLHKHGDLFRNTDVSSRYFCATSRENARPALLHTAHLWSGWSTLTECVRTGTMAVAEEMSDRGVHWADTFIAAMHRNAMERAPLVVEAVGTAGILRMLDVGGGSGAYSIAFAKANRDLEAEIFDVPVVAPIAERTVRLAGLADRVSVRVGDLRSDRFGEEKYDLILLSAICHMLGTDENCDLLSRCYAALAWRGRIVIQDFILEPDKTSPKSAALFALNMLVGTRSGRSYSELEYSFFLQGAGFCNIRRVWLPGPTGLIIAMRF
jgi:(2Fe-2S) ferredoxin/predicted O-methyltransferase YrrM